MFFSKGTERDKKPWGINIGNVFLKDFVVTIDYRRKLVTLETALTAGPMLQFLPKLPARYDMWLECKGIVSAWSYDDSHPAHLR